VPEAAAPRAAVVGADGFIGRALTLALSSMGVQVDAYSRGRRLRRGPSVTPALRDAQVIFYLASSVTPALGDAHPDWVAADHARFAALLRGLARLDHPPAVVLSSSGGTVYDACVPPPYAEDAPLRATSLYAAAKIALEAELAGHAGAVPGVVVRLGNVYGPGQHTARGYGVIAAWLHSAIQHGSIALIGDACHTRDYVYIDDVTDCLCLLYRAITDGTAGGGRGPLILNVGSGRGASLGEIAGIVQDVLGRELLVQVRPARRHDRPHVWLDCGRAERVLGWHARTCLRDGVLAMWRGLTSAQTCGDTGFRPVSEPAAPSSSTLTPDPGAAGISVSARCI
jgi:UDP-glucose 4-epimerase